MRRVKQNPLVGFRFTFLSKIRNNLILLLSAFICFRHHKILIHNPQPKSNL